MVTYVTSLGTRPVTYVTSLGTRPRGGQWKSAYPVSPRPGPEATACFSLPLACWYTFWCFPCPILFTLQMLFRPCIYMFTTLLHIYPTYIFRQCTARDEFTLLAERMKRLQRVSKVVSEDSLISSIQMQGPRSSLANLYSSIPAGLRTTSGSTQ